MWPEVLTVNSAISSQIFRTVKTRLERTEDLIETVNEFNMACQRVLDRSHEKKEYGKTRSHRATYRDIHILNDLPTLPSALVQTARDQASDTLGSWSFQN